MQLLKEKFKDHLEKINNKGIYSIIDDVYVFDVSKDDPDDIDPNNTIAVCGDCDTAKAIELIYKYKVQHFVNNDRNDFFYDLFASVLLLKKPERFLANPIPFFLQKSNNPMSGELQREAEFVFSDSSKKLNLLSAVGKFIQDNSATKVFNNEALVIVDELVSNALYHGPVDGNKKPLFANVKRGSYVTFPNNKSAKVTISHDDKRLLISCEDPFGTVSESRLLRRLFEIYYRGHVVPRSNQPGSGLGFKLIIDKSCGLYVIVDQYKKTYVCCSIPLGEGKKAVEELPKNFHFCFI